MNAPQPPPAGKSLSFFDQQFRQQVAQGEHVLNPFERKALPLLQGRVLDYGCGLGHLAAEAARRGACQVVAMDASPAAVAHLRALAEREQLPLTVLQADLRSHRLSEDFDTIACIGLLMFFDCATALRQLAQLQARLLPGGVLVVNVLVQGTSFMEMFEPQEHCLLAEAELLAAFAGWQLLALDRDEFPAPGATCKRFVTVTARKPSPATPVAGPGVAAGSLSR